MTTTCFTLFWQKEPSPGWAPLAWLSCATVCRQWRRLMFELPLAWCYDRNALDEVKLEQVKTTKLRLKTVVEEDRWRDGHAASYSTPLISELLFDPQFQQQQGSTLSNLSALLPGGLNVFSFYQLASSYPLLASMAFEPKGAP